MEIMAFFSEKELKMPTGMKRRIYNVRGNKRGSGNFRITIFLPLRYACLQRAHGNSGLLFRLGQRKIEKKGIEEKWTRHEGKDVKDFIVQYVITVQYAIQS